MSNIALAQNLLNSLFQNGVCELVICAGARNAPFVEVLSQDNPFTKFSFFEERSAGFFALGRILDSRRPVAVITTSGTAAAELLPAVIEADYQGLPLVVVTADRPKSYRGRGAPQAIVQPGLFSYYVERTWDLEGEVPPLEIPRQRPSHINFCMDEPLIDSQVPVWAMAPASETCPAPLPTPAQKVEVLARKPLVIVGSLTAEQSQKILPILQEWRRPLFLEGPSQLRGHPELAAWALQAGESALRKIDFDCVVRIGGVPTLRFWRDLEKSRVPVVNFSDLPFAGLARTCELNPLQALEKVSHRFQPVADGELDLDRERALKLQSLFKHFPLSEPAWMHELSMRMEPSARVYLGNSLPIREWDLAATQKRAFEVFANRGVNGIDGQLSTFLGLAREDRPNWCVLGDLTTLYDLSGPWALRARPLKRTHLVIINNGGGKIFERIFGNPLFENPHDLRFGDWARMWNLDYQLVSEPAPWSSPDSVLVSEILPSSEQTRLFWEEWSQ